MKAFLVCFAVMLLAFFQTAQAHTLSVKLIINNTDNMVHIPGQGEVASSGMSDGYYFSPPHHYLASYLGGAVNALVSDSSESLVTNSTADNHTLGINQRLSGSRVLLAFTKGDWQTIDDRIALVESGIFFTKMLPSFAYNIANSLYPLKMVLAYSSIDILGDMVLGRGSHTLLISNEGVSAGRPMVRMESV